VKEESKLINLFNGPKIIGLVGNTNEGKSNLIYWLVEELRKKGSFEVATYGLRAEVKGSLSLNSIPELEQVRNSLVIIDEIRSLFNLDDRTQKQKIENTLRLVHHNNNIILLSGVGENFPKFLSSKLSAIIYKKIDIADLINGSKVKLVLLGYRGAKMGSSVLALDKEEVMVYDGLHYFIERVPYMKQYDTKAKNVAIFVGHKVEKV